MNLNDVAEAIEFAVAALMFVSVVFYIKTAFFDHRPQKLGLLLALLAIPLYAVYYSNLWPDGLLGLTQHQMREPIRASLGNLDQIGGQDLVTPDAEFKASWVAALIIAVLMLVRITVMGRVAVRERLQKLHDPIANFFGLTSVATLVGAMLVSTFHWGWIGGIIVTVVFTLVYLGALALIAAILEVTLEVSKLISVWIKRRIFLLGTLVTRVASFVSSLGGRLVPGNLVRKIREDTSRQESIFMEEQESQDRQLADAYQRDLERKLMQQRQTRGSNGPDNGTAYTEPARSDGATGQI